MSFFLVDDDLLSPNLKGHITIVTFSVDRKIMVWTKLETISFHTNIKLMKFFQAYMCLYIYIENGTNINAYN